MVSSLSTGAPQVPVPSNGTVTQQADVFHSSTIPSVPPSKHVQGLVQAPHTEDNLQTPAKWAEGLCTSTRHKGHVEHLTSVLTRRSARFTWCFLQLDVMHQPSVSF